MWKRLLAGFVVTLVLAWVCYRVLPGMGVDIPWWVPLLGFAVILFAAVVSRAAETPEAADEDSSDVAGRIGPGTPPDDPWSR